MTTKSVGTRSQESKHDSSDHDLLGGIRGAEPEVCDAISCGNREVRSAGVRLREAIEELHASEDAAWRDYATTIDRSLVRLDGELQIAAARLRAERAESREELSETLHGVAETLRGLVDDARVQARLAQMEGRDAGRRAAGELPVIRDALEGAIRHLGHDVGSTLHDARHDTLEAIGRVAAGLRGGHHDLPEGEG